MNDERRRTGISSSPNAPTSAFQTNCADALRRARTASAGSGWPKTDVPATNSAEILDFSQDTPEWKETMSMYNGRVMPDSILLPDAKVLVLGGGRFGQSGGLLAHFASTDTHGQPDKGATDPVFVIHLTAGGSQRAFARDILPAAITVDVRDESGAPAPGIGPADAPRTGARSRRPCGSSDTASTADRGSRGTMCVAYVCCVSSRTTSGPAP